MDWTQTCPKFWSCRRKVSGMFSLCCILETRYHLHLFDRIKSEAASSSVFDGWDVNSDWTRWQVRTKEGTQKPSQENADKPQHSSSFPPPAFLSDILETGNKKERSLTRKCKPHQLLLGVQIYLAETCDGKTSDPDGLCFGWM